MDTSFPQNKDSGNGHHSQDASRPPKKSKAGWFWMLFFTVMAGVAIGIWGALFSGDMLDVVSGQLEKIREHRITEAYYEYTSKAFQENTSLENFRNFLTLYKVLSDNKSFRFEDQNRQREAGTITGVLISDDLQEMQAEYQLVREGNIWKIQSIRLKELQKGSDHDSATQQLVNLVHDQLKAMQKDEVMDAYYSYFSREFQNETPLKSFQDYVHSHPILTSYKTLQFNKRQIEDSTGYVDVELGSDKGKYLLEYVLKFANGEWKVWSMRLVLPPDEAAKKSLTDPNALSHPVRDLLDDLLMDKVEKAYSGTAKEFQEATSLAAFEKFVHTYPVLTRRDLTDIRMGSVENGVGKLKVNLHDEDGLTVIEFKLGYDEGVWKIWGVQVLETPERENDGALTQEPKSTNLQDLKNELIDVVQSQLQAMKYQDFRKAYQDYTSKEYQEAHTLAEFESYVEATPPFNQGVKQSFERMEQKGRKMVLRGELTTLASKKYPVEYELQKENGNWKIDRFETIPEHAPIAEAEVNLKKEDFSIKESIDKIVPSTDIKKITIGNEVDENGIIKTPRIVLDTDTNLIFFNVDIEKGEEGALVMLFLNHVDSGTTAPALSTKLKKGGHTIISFSYAAPPGGWPEGNYLVKITTSTGDEHIQGFQLRKGESKFY